MITLVLGGARSGKSALAERAVLTHGDRVVYIATGLATDDDMARRIAVHRERRDARFETIEAGADLARALLDAPPRPALVDSLGTWVAAHHDFAVDLDALTGALRQRSTPTVVVSEEVGFGVHPETAVGRAFRDALGTINQAVAAIATDVVLVVAGRVLPLATTAEAGWPEPNISSTR